jgi:hypothetical protein
MSMLKMEKNMTKLEATFPHRHMTTYEWCKKVGVMLDPLYIE